jgi:hypothetical protein
MSDWLSDVIGEDLMAIYEGHYFTEDAFLWLRERPRAFGELRAGEIDWLRWMAANIQDKDMLENCHGILMRCPHGGGVQPSDPSSVSSIERSKASRLSSSDN